MKKVKITYKEFPEIYFNALLKTIIKRNLLTKKQWEENLTKSFKEHFKGKQIGDTIEV